MHYDVRRLITIAAALAMTSILPGIASAQTAATLHHMAPLQHSAKRLHQALLEQRKPHAAPAPQAKSVNEIAGRPIVGTLHLTATAYGPNLQDNYPYGAVDYFGRPLVAGDVAVDPRVIPLGTLLWVTGYSSSDLPAGGFLARAVDMGNAIQGNRIDIFINAARPEVSNFGIQDVTAFVLK